MKVSLNDIDYVRRHVVTKVVKAKLGVGGVSDITGVIALAVEGGHVVLDQAHAQAEEAMDLPHPLGIAPGQVVVDGDHMHTTAGEGVEIGRQGGDQGLALAGLHLGDLAVVQHHAADQLHIEVAHAEHPLAGLTHHGEGLGEQLIEQLALAGQDRLFSTPDGMGISELLAEFRRKTPQVVVGEGGDLLLEETYVGNEGLIALQLAGIGITQQQLEHRSRPTETAQSITGTVRPLTQETSRGSGFAPRITARREPAQGPGAG